MKDHLTSVRMGVIEKTRDKGCQGCGEIKTLCTVSGNVN